MSQSNGRVRARARECVITRDIDTYRMNDKHLAVKLNACRGHFSETEFLRI